MTKAKTTKTIKVRVKKNGKANSGGYSVCRNCGGDGVVKNRKSS